MVIPNENGYYVDAWRGEYMREYCLAICSAKTFSHNYSHNYYQFFTKLWNDIFVWAVEYTEHMLVHLLIAMKI